MVVPTRDRPQALTRCLAALSRQADVELEIVVVDDGSRAPDAVKQAVDAVSRARLVNGGGAGPAAARNAGARHAQAELICLTDDDCEPDARWAAALARAITAGASLVAGKTVNARPDDPFSIASQTLSDHFGVHGDEGFVASNNVGCRAEVLRTFPFDDRYPDAAGEDREWCARLVAAGHRVTIEPEAVVRHRQELGWRGFVRQQRRYGGGAWRFRQARRDVRRRQDRGFYAHLVREGFRSGPAVGLLVLISQVAVGIGFIEAALAERRPNRANVSGAGSAFVLYDRDCGFCRCSLAWVLAWDRSRRLRPVALQEPEAERLVPGIERGAMLDSAHVVLSDGRVYSGGDAVGPLLRLLPGGWPLARLAQTVEGVTRTAYAWVARHRRLLGRPLSKGAKARATARIDRHAA